MVFEAEESVKEVSIPIYNHPSQRGQVHFKVALKSPPGGPRTGEPFEAIVGITFVPLGERQV